MKRPALLVTAVLGVFAVAVGSSCVQLGQTPAAGQGSISEFPDYPGATRVEFSQGADAEHGFSRKVEAKWTSTAPYQTVVAHYQKAIADAGWTVTEIKSNAAETEWKLAKGTSVAKIEVKLGPPVTIKVERSDR
jgi:hypothetical protein